MHSHPSMDPPNDEPKAGGRKPPVRTGAKAGAGNAGETRGSLEASTDPNVRRIYLIRFLFWMHFVAAVLVPFYLEWGRLRFSQILFLNAWFMLWMAVFEVPTGVIADLFGRRRSIQLGVVIAILGTLLYVSVPNFFIFLAAETILAAAYTLLSGAEEALVYDTLACRGEARTAKSVFARMEAFKLYGIVVGAMAGGVIAKFLGVRYPLLFQVLPLVLCAVMAWGLREPGTHQARHRPPFWALLQQGWRAFKQEPALRALTLDMVLIHSLAWLIIWFYQVLLRTAGVDILWFGLVHAAMCLGQAAVIENFDHWERWLGGKRRWLLWSPVIAGAGFILLGTTHHVVLVILGIVIVSTFGLSRTPLFSNYMNKVIGSETRATTLSIISMMRTLGIFIFNLLAGFLADASVPTTMLLVGATMILIAVFSGIREEHLLD